MPPHIEIGQVFWEGESRSARGGLVSPGGETIKPGLYIRLKCNRSASYIGESFRFEVKADLCL